MSSAETKAHMKRVAGSKKTPHRNDIGPSRQFVCFNAEEKEAIRQAVQAEKRRAVPGIAEIVAGASQYCSNLCDQANKINGEIGGSKETEVIISKIFDETEKAVLLVDDLPMIIDQMNAGEKTVEECYNSCALAQDQAIRHRNAAHQAFEELKVLQRRLWAKNRGENVVQQLLSLGVKTDLAQDLARIDWTLAAPAIEAARIIAAAKDKKNLPYAAITTAIEAVFREKKYDLDTIISERKYYYEGGLPEANRIVKDIESKSGISFAALKQIPGQGIVYDLRRMKAMAIIRWLFYQPEYFWRYENILGETSPVVAKAAA